MQPHVQEVVDRFGAAVARALGTPYSAVVYGSAARSEHLKGRSDLNVLLVTQALGPSVLATLEPAIELLRGHTTAPPLLFTEAEWRRSADVFPIEIADMQVARVVVAGPDPVAGLTVAPADLRRALERDFRGKLLRFRQAYAVFGHRPEALGEALTRGVSSVAVLLRVALVLVGEAPPISTTEAVTRAAERMGFPATAVTDLLEARSSRGSHLDRLAAERFVAALEAVVHFIDQFTVEGDS